MKYGSIIILLSIIAFFPGCSDDDKEDSPSLPEFGITAEIVHPERGNDLYASWLYLAPGLKQVYDNALFAEDIVELTFPNPGKGTRIGLQMTECDIVDAAYSEEITGAEDTIKLRFPTAWKLETLRKWDTEKTVTLSWQVAINGSNIGTYQKEFLCHPAEDCIVKINSGQSFSGTKAMYAGYTDEDHPILNTLIREALELGIIPTFDDYQRGPEYVRQQLLAMWSVLEYRGIKPLQQEENTDEKIQKIRSVSQVLKDKTGSTEDIVMLFTAFCQRVGFCTTIETRPNGAYIGIADNFYSEDPELIYFLDINKLSGTPEGNRESFEQALSSGEQMYREDEQARRQSPSDHEEIWVDFVRLHVPSLALSRD